MKKLRFAAALATVCFVPGLLCAAPETFEVDPVHSFIVFKVRHANLGNAYGTFNTFKGTIVRDKEAPEKSSIQLEIDVNSLDTKNPKRDEHSKSPDFLNAKQFPIATFKSDSIKKLSDTEYEVAGQMTLHGVTKPVTAKMVQLGEITDQKGVHKIGGETTFVIKRSDFGMTNMLNALGDEITLTVAVEAAAKPAAAPAPAQ